VPYFVSFIVLGTMIILNLFIGIVMNSMTETHAELTGRAAPGGAGTADVARDLAEIQRRLARIQEQLQHPPRT
jgi:voltage-gated sodium channel